VEVPTDREAERSHIHGTVEGQEAERHSPGTGSVGRKDLAGEGSPAGKGREIRLPGRADGSRVALLQQD